MHYVLYSLLWLVISKHNGSFALQLPMVAIYIYETQFTTSRLFHIMQKKWPILPFSTATKCSLLCYNLYPLVVTDCVYLSYSTVQTYMHSTHTNKNKSQQLKSTVGSLYIIVHGWARGLKVDYLGEWTIRENAHFCPLQVHKLVNITRTWKKSDNSLPGIQCNIFFSSRHLW